MEVIGDVGDGGALGAVLHDGDGVEAEESDVDISEGVGQGGHVGLPPRRDLRTWRRGGSHLPQGWSRTADPSHDLSPTLPIFLNGPVQSPHNRAFQARLHSDS